VTVISRRQPATTGFDLDLLGAARQFLRIREEMKLFREREAALKRDLGAYVERHGAQDEKGSFWVRLPEVIGTVRFLKREKYGSKKLVPDKAERILRRLGLYERCIDTAVVIPPDNVDAVLAALATAGALELVDVQTTLNDDYIMQSYYAEDGLTDSDIDAMFTEEINYRFVTAAGGPEFDDE